MTLRSFFTHFFCLFLPLFMAIFSCSNLSESSGSKNSLQNSGEQNAASDKNSNLSAGQILIRVGTEKSLGKNARYAAPSEMFDISKFAFAAALYESSYSDSLLAEGTPSAAEGTIDFVLKRPSATSGLTLKVLAFKNGTTEFAEADAALFGELSSIEIAADATSITKTISLKPKTNSSKKGTVKLSVALPEGHTLSCDDANFSCSGSGAACEVSASLSPGSYEILFSVLNSSGVTVYAWKENVCVIANMETNAWSGGDVKTISVQSLAKTLFVRGSGGDYAGISAAAGSDTEGSGSLMRPFATVQKAVQAILERNDGSSEYAILVSGTVQAEAGQAVCDLSEALEKNLNLTIKAFGSGTQKAVLKGNGSRVINAGNSSGGTLTLNLEKLSITNGSISGSSGGGIRLQGKAEVLIKSCSITQNSTSGSSSTGGGIYASNSKLTIEDCEVANNNAGLNGGGISVSSFGVEKLEIKNTKVTGNKANGASSKGGGIFVSGSVCKMTNCTQISGNSAAQGSGVCVGSGSVRLSGATFFEDEIHFNGIYSIYVFDDFSLSGTQKIPLALGLGGGDLSLGSIILRGVGGSMSEDQCNAFSLASPFSDEYSIQYQNGAGVLSAPLAMTAQEAVLALQNAALGENLSLRVAIAQESDLEDIAEALETTNAQKVSLVIESVPSGVTAIGTVSFGQSALSEITIPEGIDTIKKDAFRGAANLERVTISSSVKTIGENAFANCVSLSEITIPGSVSVIGGSAFDNCQNLSSVTLSEGIEEIGDWAFYHCSIASLTLPQSLQRIGYQAFTSATLESVQFLDTAGWHADKNGYSGGSAIDVSDAALNGQKLQDTTENGWSVRYLYKE